MQTVSANGAVSSAVQAVIFDLDGVLMNSEWLAFQVWREWAEQVGGTLSDADFAGMVGISAEDTAEYVMRRSGLTFDVAESCAWTWRRMTERLKDEIAPLPGSTDLVRRLAKRGCSLAVASNALSFYIDNALTGLELDEFFPIRVGIDQVERGKPAPDVYLRAAERLGVRPADCLAVEDSPVGVQAAASAGMRVIAVPTAQEHPDSFHRAWRVYPSLTRVVEEMDEVLSAN